MLLLGETVRVEGFVRVSVETAGVWGGVVVTAAALQKDLVHWTIGRWWMRRKQHDLDFFVFSSSCPPLKELNQY